MPTFSRRPCALLAPWVQILWATRVDPAERVAPYRERVLPTGAMHVVMRLDGVPLTLFHDATAEASQTVGHAVVGGARSTHYVKLAGEAACSVGAQLQPGAAQVLLGVPAGELAERHTALDALWATDAARLHERLLGAAYECEQRSPVVQLHERLHRVSEQGLARPGPTQSDLFLKAQVDLLESTLLLRLRQAGGHERQLEWLRQVVGGIDANLPLASIVEQSGVSHRTFITRFRSMVGLSPKVYARIRRFQRVVMASHGVTRAHASESNNAGVSNGAAGAVSLAHLAFDTGYADQAHLSRDFLEFAGVSPSTYCRFPPSSANHVRIRP